MQSSTDANLAFSNKYNDFISEGGTVTGGLQLGDYEIYTMIGGCSVNQGVLISPNEIGNLQVGYFIKELNKDNYVRIIEIIKDPYSENFRVIFQKPVVFSMDNVITSYETYDTPFGKFSAYDFKDFNFDFLTGFYFHFTPLMIVVLQSFIFLSCAIVLVDCKISYKCFIEI